MHVEGQTLIDHAAPLPAGPKYEPIFELGRGGMATVYLAINRGLAGWSKLVVLKQLRPDVASDPDFLPMLLEEARIAARINHPNVVQTNDIGFDGHAHYIAMEYLEGQTLQGLTRRLTEQGRRLPLPLYLHILAQVLRGLHFAHELADYDGAPLSIVHRDMTPHNVFVTYEGVVKVLDFGIAKAADSKNETRSGTFKGKLRYIAPEQALGIPIDRRADIFAIGVMMWHALAGTRMWKDVSETDVLMQLAKGEIPNIAEVAPSAPPELLSICRRALAHRPTERFATAAEMMDALESYLAQTHSQLLPRELAQFVDELFGERRATVRAAIDQRVREGLSGDSVPVLSSAGGTRSSHSKSDASLAAAPASVPSLSGPRSLPFTSHSPSNTGSSPFASHPEGGPAPVSPFRRHAAGAVFGLLIAAAGFGVYKFAGQKTAPAVAPAQSAPAQSAAGAVSATSPDTAPLPAPAASGPPMSRLQVTVTPPSANVRLDGAPFPGDSQVPRDGASHRLEIDAPGFKSESDYVVFDRDDVALTYTLAKKDAPAWHSVRPSKKGAGAPSGPGAPPEAGSPAAQSSPPAAAAAGSPPAPASSPGHKHKPKTSLDSADPWK